MVHWIPIHMMHNTYGGQSHLWDAHFEPGAALKTDGVRYRHTVTNTEKRDMYCTYTEVDVQHIYQHRQRVKEREEGDTYSHKVTGESGAGGEGKWIQVIGCSNRRGEKKKGNIIGVSPMGRCDIIKALLPIRDAKQRSALQPDSLYK